MSVEVRTCLSPLPHYRGIGTFNINVSAEYAGLAHHSLFLRYVLNLTVNSLSKGRYNLLFEIKPAGKHKHNIFLLDERNPASVLKIRPSYQAYILTELLKLRVSKGLDFPKLTTLQLLILLLLTMAVT